MKECSICKFPYTGYGNNAVPINDGRCCDTCNLEQVIPARISNVIKVYQEADKNDTNPLKNFKN